MSAFRGVDREKSLIYMNSKPTIPLNDGRYNVNFDIVKAHTYKANFSRKHSVEPRQ